MASKGYLIRNTGSGEMPLLLNMAANEGWNPGIYDPQLFYHADNSGFFVLEINNQIAGCISAVAYDKSFGFIGLYIVRPEYRGKGYGLKLWKHAMKYLHSRNIGLDGVVEQQHNYRKSGFKLAYNNIRYQYITQGKLNGADNCIELSGLDFQLINEYDQRVFPSPRTEFLKNWINQPESISLGIQFKKTLEGYIIIRKCLDGYKIGPLFANNSELAETMFINGINRLPNDVPVFLDIPEYNPAAKKITNKYSMVKVFETARMYNKFEPEIEKDRIFGVTTFELG